MIDRIRLRARRRTAAAVQVASLRRAGRRVGHAPAGPGAASSAAPAWSAPPRSARQLVTTRAAFAATPTEHRNTLVLVFLRGAADGLRILVPEHRRPRADLPAPGARRT